MAVLLYALLTGAALFLWMAADWRYGALLWLAALAIGGGLIGIALERPSWSLVVAGVGALSAWLISRQAEVLAGPPLFGGPGLTGQPALTGGEAMLATLVASGAALIGGSLGHILGMLVRWRVVELPAGWVRPGGARTSSAGQADVSRAIAGTGRDPGDDPGSWAPHWRGWWVRSGPPTLGALAIVAAAMAFAAEAAARWPAAAGGWAPAAAGTALGAAAGWIAAPMLVSALPGSFLPRYLFLACWVAALALATALPPEVAGLSRGWAASVAGVAAGIAAHVAAGSLRRSPGGLVRIGVAWSPLDQAFLLLAAAETAPVLWWRWTGSPAALVILSVIVAVGPVVLAFRARHGGWPWLAVFAAVATLLPVAIAAWRAPFLLAGVDLEALSSWAFAGPWLASIVLAVARWRQRRAGR